MVLNGGGDALLATIRLRERGKLDAIGGLPYLQELQDAVPSAENLDYYLPDLRDYFRRRQVINAATRLKLLAEDPSADSAVVLADTEAVLEALNRQADANALPEIISAKESIDRISGSGVFARDPDSLIAFTKHEEEGAFTVELTLRNLPPLDPFVVKWQWPLFRRADSLDPSRLKQAGGRPTKHKAGTLLECLGDQRLKSMVWRDLARDEFGIPNGRFFELLRELEQDGKVQKSALDGKWEQIQTSSGNSPRHNDE